MTAVVRASRLDDLDALYEMAKLAGAGFTNLPADRDVLAEKLTRSQTAFDKATDEPGSDQYVLIMEDGKGKVIGTAQIFSQIGLTAPFYSYRIGTLSQNSKELGRTFKAEILNLTTDYEGCSEVGGLFLHPRERAGGLGMLLARSRYLFIREHRARFAQRVIAELRGMIDEAGASPFWDALAGRFFGMTFEEADSFNSTHGHQFIADLMPKHPIYTAMLTESARVAMGKPHQSGRAALRMLEEEGFHNEGYIDIFDGGPTIVADTDRVRSIANAETVKLVAIATQDGTPAIASTGHLTQFRAVLANAVEAHDGISIDPLAASLLNIEIGDYLTYVAR